MFLFKKKKEKAVKEEAVPEISREELLKKPFREQSPWESIYRSAEAL